MYYNINLPVFQETSCVNSTEASNFYENWFWFGSMFIFFPPPNLLCMLTGKNIFGFNMNRFLWKKNQFYFLTYFKNYAVNKDITNWVVFFLRAFVKFINPSHTSVRQKVILSPRLNLLHSGRHNL